MAKLFRLSITTPDKTVYDGNVQSLVAPAQLGYLGILADHAPLATPLTAGRITLRDASGKATLFNMSESGFLEVSNNKATLLLNSI